MNDIAALKLFVVLCRTFSCITGTVKKDIKRYGLSLSEFETLELLYHKGAQSVQNIGKKVLLTSGSMTYVVDQMIKKELCTREICEHDRRIIHVHISEKGRELMNEIFPQHERIISEIFATLSAQEIRDMTQKLKQVSKSIEIMEENK